MNKLLEEYLINLERYREKKAPVNLYPAQKKGDEELQMFQDWLTQSNKAAASQGKSMDSAQSSGWGDFFGSAAQQLLAIPKLAAKLTDKVSPAVADFFTQTAFKSVLPGFAQALVPNAALPTFSQASAQADKITQEMVKDPTSWQSMAGTVVGAALPVIATGGAGAAALAGRGALQGAVTLGALGETTVGSMLSYGAASALQDMAVNYDAFDKKDAGPDKMTGAEYTLRGLGNFLTGALTAGVNPARGFLFNAAVDGATNAASAGVVDLAALAGANDARRDMIVQGMGQNALTAGLTGAAVGSAIRGVGLAANKISEKLAEKPVSTPLPASTTTQQQITAQTTPVSTAKAKVVRPEDQPITPQQLSVSEKYIQLYQDVVQYVSGMTPEQMAIQAKIVGADVSGPITPQLIAEKVIASAKATDPMNTGSGLEYVDGVLKTNFYDKASKMLRSEVEAIARQEIQSQPPQQEAQLRELSDEEMDYGAPLPPEMTRVASGPEDPIEYFNRLAQEYEQRQQQGAVAQPRIQQPIAESPVKPVEPQQTQPTQPELGPRELTDEEMDYGAPLPPEMAPKSPETAESRAAFLKEWGGLLEPKKVTPAAEPSIQESITGEPNVQQRTTDVTNGEPGQPIIAGEPTTQAGAAAEPVAQAEATQAQASAQGRPAVRRVKRRATEQTPLFEESQQSIQEPIAGEPNATQEGQVPEGSQPEYIGTAQREAVPENIQEVRQEKSGRPGDSNRPQPESQAASVEPTPEAMVNGDKIVLDNKEYQFVKVNYDRNGGPVSIDVVDAGKIKQLRRPDVVKSVSEQLQIEREIRYKSATKRATMKEVFNKFVKKTEGLTAKKFSDVVDAAREMYAAERSGTQQDVDTFTWVHQQLKDAKVPNAQAKLMARKIEGILRCEPYQPIAEKLIDAADSFIEGKEATPRSQRTASRGAKSMRDQMLQFFDPNISSVEGTQAQLAATKKTSPVRSVAEVLWSYLKETDPVINRLYVKSRFLVGKETANQPPAEQLYTHILKEVYKGKYQAGEQLTWDVKSPEGKSLALVSITPDPGGNSKIKITAKVPLLDAINVLGDQIKEEGRVQMARERFGEGVSSEISEMFSGAPQGLASEELYSEDPALSIQGGYFEDTRKQGRAQQQGFDKSRAITVEENVNAKKSFADFIAGQFFERKPIDTELLSPVEVLNERNRQNMEEADFLMNNWTPESKEQYYDKIQQLIDDNNMSDALKVDDVVSVLDKRAKSAEITTEASQIMMDMGQRAVPPPVKVPPKSGMPKLPEKKAPPQDMFPGFQVNASLGFMPAVLTADLNDDEEYFMGVTGKQIKALALGIGAFATVRLGSKAGVFRIGSKVLPEASKQSVVNELANSKAPNLFAKLREKQASYKDHVRAIRENTSEIARSMNASPEEAARMLAKNIKDDRELDGMPFIGSISNATSMDILSKTTGHEYPQQLNQAVYDGKTIADILSVGTRDVRQFFNGLGTDLQAKLAELVHDVDWDTTEIGLGRRDSFSGRVSDFEYQENPDNNRSFYYDRLDASLKSKDPELYDAYKTLETYMAEARRAAWDAECFEKTGIANVYEANNRFSAMVTSTIDLMDAQQLKIKELHESGAETNELERAITALRGMQQNYSTALKMRGLTENMMVARQESISRRYMPREVFNRDADYHVRVRRSALDTGEVVSFTKSGQYDAYIAEMTKDRTPEELGLTSSIHPITGQEIKSYKDLYLAEGGVFDTVRGKTSQREIAQASVDPLLIREALEMIADYPSGGTIPVARIQELYKAYGESIQNLVDAKTLQDLNISLKIDSKTMGQSGIPVAKLRQLINAIEVPRYTDSTKARYNVKGYAPSKVDPVTGALNPNYSTDIINWFSGAVDSIEAKIRAKSEQGQIRRVANTQIADLASRGIAPRYTQWLSSLVTGLTWTPRSTYKGTISNQTLRSFVDPIIGTAEAVDRGLALYGSFNMLGFSTTAPQKNVLLGVNNLAVQLAAEGKPIISSLAKSEGIYGVRALRDLATSQTTYEYLRRPESIAPIDEKVAAMISSDPVLEQAYRLNQLTGGTEAAFYKGLEKEAGNIFAEGSYARKVVELAQIPQKAAEHHNRSISFLSGAMQHLEGKPNDSFGAYIYGQKVSDDVIRAYAAGQKMAGITQGNFANYNMSALERAVAEFPMARSIMLLKKASIQSFTQLASHFLVAAVSPVSVKAKTKIIAPILTHIACGITMSGLTGLALTADVYQGLEWLYNSFQSISGKSDNELASVYENFSDYIKRKTREMGDAFGFSTEASEQLYNATMFGTLSTVTGRNYTSENTVSQLIFGELPVYSLGKKVVSVAENPDPVAVAGIINAQLGRVVRSIAQLKEGGKRGKGGYIVDNLYSPSQAIMDMTLPSDLREAMHGANKADGGGTIYYPDAALAYLEKLDGIDGLKMNDAMHKDIFRATVPGYQVPQYQPNAVNRLRGLIITNYASSQKEIDSVRNVWNEIKSRPDIVRKLSEVAMRGQKGSRISDQVDQMMKQADNKIKNYYLARSVQKAYVQLGIPPPAYKYANRDPLTPLIKFIDSKIKKMIMPAVQEEQTPYNEYVPLQELEQGD